MVREFIAAFKADPRADAQHSGVKGMKWGVRRSSSQLRSAAKSGGASSAKKETASAPAASSSGGGAKKPAGDIQDRVESSSDRYARLTSKAKNGQASTMSDQDLKFVNARTEALAKVTKLAEVQPSWLKDTSTKVVQQTAQRQMQTLADTLADKYIGTPIKTAINGAAK